MRPLYSKGHKLVYKYVITINPNHILLSSFVYKYLVSIIKLMRDQLYVIYYSSMVVLHYEVCSMRRHTTTLLRHECRLNESSISSLYLNIMQRRQACEAAFSQHAAQSRYAGAANQTDTDNTPIQTHILKQNSWNTF